MNTKLSLAIFWHVSALRAPIGAEERRMSSEEGGGNAHVAIAASMHSSTIPSAASGCQNQPSAKEAVLLPLLSSFRLYVRSVHFCNALSGIRPQLPAPTRHRVPMLMRCVSDDAPVCR